MTRWQLSASAVTMRPLSDSRSSSFGTAVISLDLPSTASWPSSSRWSADQAWSMCSGDLPAARSKERRSVLPSIATTPCKHALQGFGEALHEAREAGFERGRIEESEHPAEGVMAMDAVPQAQELPQERFLDRAEQRHVRAILAAGQYGAERDQQQFMQIMAGIIL